MSWFKNLKRIFGNNDNEEYEEYENHESERHESINGQMETKVTYQYPKGNFRFPLRVEEEGNTSHRTNTSKIKENKKYQHQQQHQQHKQQDQQQHQNGPIKKSHPNVDKSMERSFSKTVEISTPPEKQERVQTKIQPKIKQPFRPTEIPSPVYGFRRPPRRNDLNSKSQNDLNKQEDKDPQLSKALENKNISARIDEVNTDNLVVEKEIPMEHTLDIVNQKKFHPFENEIKDQDQLLPKQYEPEKEIVQTDQNKYEVENPKSFEQNRLDEVLPNINNETEMVEQQGEILSVVDQTITEQSTEQSVQEEEVAFIYNQTEALVVEQPVPQEKTSQKIDQSEIQMEEQPDIELSEQAVEEKAFINTNQMEETEEEQPLVVEDWEEDEEIIPLSTINAKVESNGHLEEQNEIHVDELELPEDIDENELNSELQSDSIHELTPSSMIQDVEVEKEESIASNEAPARTHIPFNVIMLKKDRENIQRKQVAMEIQQASTQTTAEMEIQQARTQTTAEREIQQANTQTAVAVDTEEYVEEDYVFPALQLLNPPVHQEMDKDWLNSQSDLLDETLLSFNVRAKVVNVSQGPSVTRFEVQPEPGVKVNKITNLSDDIKLSLAAKDIRMEAPIPGKHTIGIELPNVKSRPVYISEIISSEIFQKSESPLTTVLGLDISGSPIITDLRKMPHGLIAGATGSGKSVCINSILISMLYKSTPDELKLLLIDPKMVELAPYNNIPHLVSPVITDVKAATAALKWAVEEMERRYELFAHTGVREIGRYNEMAEENRQFNQKLPFIVIVIDELADLMMMAPADVEEAICRIAQKARACGIHLIIATQRPSVDVITGLIKANVPTRIAFSVSSQVDSRTIIDISGAEKLLGRGDMLFLGNGTSKPIRLQGTFVSDEEIDQVVAHVRAERKPDYLFEQEELLKKAIIQDEEDEIFHDVCEFVMEQGAASTSLIQRNFRIGYNRAARLIEMMEQQGIISEAKGSKPRDILMSREEFDNLSGVAETK